jgi:hypothetical protein
VHKTRRISSPGSNKLRKLDTKLHYCRRRGTGYKSPLFKTYKLTLVLCSPNEKRIPWLRKGTEEINKTSEINKQGQKRMSYTVNKTSTGGKEVKEKKGIVTLLTP